MSEEFEANESNLTSNVTDDYEEPIETDLGEFIRENPAIFSFLLLICILTLATNTMIIAFRFNRKKSALTLASIYSYIPCFTGILVAIFNMPMDVYFTISGFNWFIGTPTCYLWYITDMVLCSINIYSFTVLTYIRFSNFRHPFRSHSRREHMAFLAFILLFPTVFWSIDISVFLTLYPPDEGDCRLTDSYAISYPTTVLFLIFPIFASMFMNVYILRQLKKKRNRIISMKNYSNIKMPPLMKDFKETKAMHKLFIIQVTFFLCWMPYICTYELHDLVIPDEWTTVVYFIAYSSSLIIATILILTSKRNWDNVKLLLTKLNRASSALFSHHL